MATKIKVSDDVRYRLMKLVDSNPEVTQREAAEHLGMSVGKLNYCMQALIGKGWVKARNFKNSRHKVAYTYLLTSKGIQEKLEATYRFLELKAKEYEALGEELRLLNEEVAQLREDDPETRSSR